MSLTFSSLILYLEHAQCVRVGGGYFTTDTRHMLYGDDGSETRLSITDLPQSMGPCPIPHPLSSCGDAIGKIKWHFPNRRLH